MKCTEFEKLVDEHIDGELSHSLTEFEEHLETCNACQQLYNETLEIKVLLNGLEELELPENFESSLHEKLVKVSRESKVIPFYRKTKTLKVMTSVAAIAVISIFAFKAGTLVPDRSNMLYSTMNVSSNDSNSNEAMPEMAMNMAVNESEESYGSDDAEATSFAVSEEPMAKSIRVEMDNDIYSDESINYWLETGTDSSQLSEFIELYDLTDLSVEDNRYTFYINNEDYAVFSENLVNKFNITNEFILEFSTGL